jgi:hypothetical protein
VIHIKILGTKSRQRYVLRRLVTAATDTLRFEYPDLEVSITEIHDREGIEAYTDVLIAPGLVINEKLVYDLWIPSKEQVIGWLSEAIQEQLVAGWTVYKQEAGMKKGIHLILEDEDIIGLMGILIDEDTEGALEFLKKHFKGKARELLEGGWKVMIEVPGAGITQISGNIFDKWCS